MYFCNPDKLVGLIAGSKPSQPNYKPSNYLHVKTTVFVTEKT